MRRYPREVDGQASRTSVAQRQGRKTGLLDHAGQGDGQLVAYYDVIQYIVDGKLIYQITRGDRIQVEGRDNQGKPVEFTRSDG